MHLDYAFLAERADRSADGRLFVFNGDMSVIKSKRFPTALQCSLVGRFAVLPSDLEHQHFVGIDVRHEGSVQRILRSLKLQTSANPIDETEESGAGLCINMTLHFKSTGRYEVALLLDDSPVKLLPLWAVLDT